MDLCPSFQNLPSTDVNLFIFVENHLESLKIQVCLINSQHLGASCQEDKQRRLHHQRTKSQNTTNKQMIQTMLMTQNQSHGFYESLFYQHENSYIDRYMVFQMLAGVHQELN